MAPSRIVLRLTPGGAAHVGLVPVGIARIRAVGVRLSLGGRIPELEAERDQATRGCSEDSGAEDGALAGVQLAATAKRSGSHNGSLPAQDAVRVARRLPV